MDSFNSFPDMGTCGIAILWYYRIQIFLLQYKIKHYLKFYRITAYRKCGHLCFLRNF